MQKIILSVSLCETAGITFNQSDWFHYEGDAKAFNDFLQQYSKVQTKHLVLNLENGKRGILVPLTPGAAANMGPGYAWQLSIFGWNEKNIGLKFPVDGKIALNDIRVPSNVTMQFFGEKPGVEVARFIADHKVRQERAKRD